MATIELRRTVAPVDAGALRASGFAGPLVGTDDPSYADVRAIWNADVPKRPALFARCAGTADVLAAVRFARREELLFSVRGGGHNVAGSALCDNGLVIDLSLLKGVRVDPTAMTADVQPGIRLGELDRETQAFGLATSAGIVSDTGVAGLTLGGGIGWLMRRYGLTIDNLISADVVTAEGAPVRASEDENADLFWGLRGGGGNFGVVTSFRYRLHPVGPEVLAGVLVYGVEEAAEVVAFLREFQAEQPDDLTMILMFRKAPPAPWVPEELHGRDILGVGVCHAGSVEDGERAIAPIRAFRRPLLDAVTPKPFRDHQAFFDASVPAGLGYYWKSWDLGELGDEAVGALVDATGRLTSPNGYVLAFQLGGAVARIGEDDAAYGHRDAGWTININGVWEPGDPDRERHVGWVRDLFGALEPHAMGVYLNFLMEEGEERVRAAYGESKFERLAALKSKYDPTNFFSVNQNIRPFAPSAS